MGQRCVPRPLSMPLCRACNAAQEMDFDPRSPEGDRSQSNFRKMHNSFRPTSPAGGMTVGEHLAQHL